MRARIISSAPLFALLLTLLLVLPRPARAQEAITIDPAAPAHPFPHFWEQMFGSGRAILSLRESYRNDLRDVKHVADFRYVRFHAILHDEVGVYDEDMFGKAYYNFTYVDQIYDGLLENGVRPVVEISFMPQKLALRPDVHPFWYKPNPAPPSDYAKWDGLMRAFAQHLVDRYGVDEVAQWYFEVWNEPNIDFWTGEPKQATYFELYDHTARALKAVNPRLRVGGPATAAAHWVPEFLAHVAKNHVPIDFVSTHGYADDSVEDMFGAVGMVEDIPMNQRVCRAIGKVRGEIRASAFPSLPLFWTEWNVPSFGDLGARDTIYVGAALADDIRQCDGLVDMMSYWTFDDVFEEGGPKHEPFDGGFGIVAPGGIRKPGYYGYGLLHQLGSERLVNDAPGVLVTRRGDGTLAVALWNMVDLDRIDAAQKGKGDPARARQVVVKFAGVKGRREVRVQRVDETHGNTLALYRAMGSPRYPTRAQVRELNERSQPGAAQLAHTENGALRLEIPVNGLVLLELKP